MFCANPHVKPDGGDCMALSQAQHQLRPAWACFSNMQAAILEFLPVYEKRPVRKNIGGMRIEHCFAMWYSLQQIEKHSDMPITTVIESGAFKGQGTWLIRQALPNARILSLDARGPSRLLDNVEYMTGSDWIDFSKVDWKAKNVDPERTVVFLDDHQSSYR
jgi:hypothetical protein